jgi:DNA-binding winged helix-turn-helix (wHTH) protein/TolB-like protein
MDEPDNISGVLDVVKSAERYIRFGEFTIDLRYAILQRHGHKVELPYKEFQVLLYLVNRPGCVVPREELRDIWPMQDEKAFLERLYVALGKIRDALEDDKDDPKYVQTIVGCGYRFTAQAEGFENDSPNQSSSSNQSESASQTADGCIEKTKEAGKTSRPPMVRIGAIGFITRRYAVLCAVALFLGSVPLGMIVRLVWATDGPPPSACRTIIIRNLQNLTTDAKQDSFCKGLGEELLAELSRKKSNSFDIVIGQDPPGNQAFENSSSKGSIFELEGSVRKEGHTLRIAIELNELQSKRVIWAELYERIDESGVPVQRDVAMQIAKGILARI